MKKIVWLEKSEWNNLIQIVFQVIKSGNLSDKQILKILKLKHKNYSETLIQSAINVARDCVDAQRILSTLDVDWFSWPIKKILRRAQNATHRINQITLERMIKKMIQHRITVYAEERVVFKHRKMKPHEIAKDIANRVWARQQFGMLVKACSTIKKKRRTEWRRQEKKYREFKKLHKELKKKQFLEAQQQARENLVSLSDFKKEKRRDMRQTC